MLTKEFLMHLSKPRNVGKIKNPTAIGTAEYAGGKCSDKVALYLKIKRDKITNAKFGASACSGTIVAMSVLTTLLKGANIDEAKKIDRSKIVDELVFVPPEKEHSLELALKALSNALSSLVDDKAPNSKQIKGADVNYRQVVD
ncbi:MAG: iron-sulfur cluster assembly scaffold protein [Candidatus Micrarchaeia archaeon]